MEDESCWTDEDKDLIGPSVNLIKAAKVGLKVIWKPIFYFYFFLISNFEMSLTSEV